MSNAQLPLVIVTHQLPEGWLDKLEGRCRPVIGPHSSECAGFAPALEAHLGEAEGLFSVLTVPVNQDLLDRAPRLRVVSNMAVGVDNVEVAACTRRGIPVGNTPGVLVDGTADLTMAILLSIARRIPEASRDAREGRWGTWSPGGWLGADLSGATLGIVGLGQIGQAVARRALGFGAQVVYTSRRGHPEAEAELRAERLPLAALLQRSDFVCLHTALTPETRHLIDEEALRLMKPTAILVNVARGPVVETDALVRALQEGWIRAAALDVTDPEPLPPDHILYTLPNCLIVPHIGSATYNSRLRMAELACDNLLAGLAGTRLPHVVNPEVY
jgi:lactate dehydrogenase-like 2-hydroxyacid dehydrogenase